MKAYRLFTSLVMFTVASCSKSDKYKPPVDNDELKATISIDGATPISYIATADAVTFITSISSNGVKEIDIACGKDNMNLNISVMNVTSPGIFNFGLNSGAQEASCLYTEGNALIGFSNQYSTVFAEASGFIKIDSLSTTYISGTFNAKCIQPPDSKVLQITSGSFKGAF